MNKRKDEALRAALRRFAENFAQYEEHVSDDVKNLPQALATIGLDVIEVNGNDYASLTNLDAFIAERTGPRVIVANTVKGKGISFMEGVIRWHHSIPNAAEHGTHVNISGVALAKYAPNKDSAIALIEYLSSGEAQKLYAELNNEYPLKAGIALSRNGIHTASTRRSAIAAYLV